MADATDLRFQFWRFLCLSLHIEATARCLGKLLKFPNFVVLKEERPEMASLLHESSHNNRNQARVRAECVFRIVYAFSCD